MVCAGYAPGYAPGMRRRENQKKKKKKEENTKGEKEVKKSLILLGGYAPVYATYIEVERAHQSMLGPCTFFAKAGMRQGMRHRQISRT